MARQADCPTARRINDHIDGHLELKQDAELIASIPGIGEVTVAKALAYAGDVRRFTNAKALAAFIGICPRKRQSGSSVKGRTMISRTGYAALRKASCRDWWHYATTQSCKCLAHG